MKNQKTLIAGLALALTFGVVSFSGAQGAGQGEHMGMNSGQTMKHCNMMKGNMQGDGMMDHGKMMGGDVASLTEAQQKEVQVIEAKYADAITALDTAITAKRTTMHTAMANDATTVGEMKKMRQGMITLHRDRQALTQKINTEIAAKIGVDYVASGQHCPMSNGGSGDCMKMGMMMDEGMHHGGEKHDAAVHM